MQQSVVQPAQPPEPPELPEGVAPRWPAWYAGVGFLVALIGTLIAALGMVSFYVLAAVYTALVSPDAEQTVAQDLGADQGTFGLIAAGFMVICVAPFAEEFFFRGFFYKALRSKYSVIVAALIDGALFGVIHYDFSGADALLILPPLAVLGFMFCLVYEKTGSLWPVIGLHAFNNAIAYGVAVEDASVSLVLGPLMLAACMVLPRLSPPVPVPRHAG